MAKDERINSVINTQAVQKEIDSTVNSLKKLVGEINKMRGEFKKTGESMRSGGIKEATKNINNLEKSAQKLTIAQKALNRETNKVTKLAAITSQENKKNIQDQQRLTQMKRDAINVAKEQALIEQRGAKSYDTLRVSIVNARAELDRMRAANMEGTAAFQAQQNEVNRLNMEFQKATQATKYFAVDMEAVRNGTNKVEMSLKQMQDELRNLQAVDFASQGLSPQEIQEVEVRMAYLTDGIADYQAKIKNMATDTIPLFAGGLQTITSVGQGVTGTMRIFGVENKNLEKSMFALMNVSMSLTAVQKAYNDKQFVAIRNRLAELVSVKKLSIVKKGEIKVTQGATKATRIWGKALKAVPILLIIAGISALVVGIVALSKRFAKASKASRLFGEAMREAGENAAEEKAKLDILTAQIIKTAREKGNVNKLVKQFNEEFKEYGANLSTEVNLTKSLEDNYKRIGNAMLVKFKIQAMEDKIVSLMKEQVDAQMDLQEVGEGFWDQTLNFLSNATNLPIEYTTYKTANLTNVLKENDDAIRTLILSVINMKNEYDELVPSLDDVNNSMSSSDIDYNIKRLEINTDVVNGLTTAWDDYMKKLQEKTELELDPAPEANARFNLHEQLSYINTLGLADEDLNNKRQQAYYDYYNTILDLAEEIAKEDGILTQKELENLDKIRAKRDENAEAEKEQMKSRKEILLATESFVFDAWSAFNSMRDEAEDNDLQRFENRQEDRLSIYQNQLDQGLITQAQFDVRSRAIAEESARQREEIATRQANRQKALAAAQTTINTSKAIMEIWADTALPTLAKPIFTAIVAAKGLFELSKITSQSIPAYAEGREGGQAELAITGDKHGREIIDTGDAMFFTPDKPTLTWLPEGADVIPNRKIESHLAEKAQDYVLGEKLDSIENAIRQKEFVGINITREGMFLQVDHQNRRVKYLNQRLKR